MTQAVDGGVVSDQRHKTSTLHLRADLRGGGIERNGPTCKDYYKFVRGRAADPTSCGITPGSPSSPWGYRVRRRGGTHSANGPRRGLKNIS